MKTIIVSGANGFIGRPCLKFLKEMGFKIHALSRGEHARDNDGVTWHKIDILNQDGQSLIKKIGASHFLHLAWYTEHGQFWNAEINNQWREASVRLMQEFYAAGGKRFVSAGTVAEYDWSYSECIEGQTPENPATLYGQSKLQFTNAIKQQAEKHQKSWAVGRVFFLFGPGEPTNRLVPSVIAAAHKNQTIQCTDGNQVRDFMYVDDVASALCHLAASEVTGPVNIASGNPLPLKSVVEAIVDFFNPRPAIHFGAVPRGKNDPDVLIANTGRLNNEVGWTPALGLQDGLKLTIDKYRERSGL